MSSAAAKAATGRDWDQWLRLLDKAGAADWPHRQIVAWLKDRHELSPWWRQTVTVAYEKARGRRVVGQTADAGFQVGVQRTLPISVDDAWALITSRRGIACWLGPVPRWRLVEGFAYETSDGAAGELRVIKPPRLRLTWRTAAMKSSATLQVLLVAAGRGRTSVRVHVEKLPSAAWRSRMKAHWRAVLDSLAALANEKQRRQRSFP